MIGGNGNKEMVHTKVGSGGVAMGAAVSHVRSPTTIRLPEAEGLVAVRGQVMTDEQMETLRRQISVYATICQQLVEMHKATMAQQQALSGLKYGHASPLDSALNSMGQKFSSRQRWTPSQTQLQILEKLFQQGNGAPSKQRIKEISTELSQYGPISETNVYNWFQNRRARTKRKQQGGTTNAESELDTDVDSQEEKRICTDRDMSNDGFAAGQSQSNSQAWEFAEHEQHYDAQKGMQSSQRVVSPGEFAMAINKTDADDGISATMGLHMSGPRTSS